MPGQPDSVPYEFDDPALVRAWVDKGLKAEYPYIRPESRLGQQILGVALTLDEIHADLDYAPEGDEHQQLAADYSQNMRKKDLAIAMVCLCQEFTQGTPIRDIDGVKLMEFIDGIATMKHESISRKALSEDDAQELHDWISSIGLFIFSGSGNFGSPAQTWPANSENLTS